VLVLQPCPSATAPPQGRVTHSCIRNVFFLLLCARETTLYVKVDEAVECARAAPDVRCFTRCPSASQDKIINVAENLGEVLRGRPALRTPLTRWATAEGL